MSAIPFGEAMTAKESFFRDYGRLAGFLRGISLRFQLLTIFEFLLLLPSGFLLVLLGSSFVLELKNTLPLLPFIFALVSLVFMLFLLSLAIWRIASGPSMERIARRVEELFPSLNDDVTNSLLLFDQVEKDPRAGQISEGLIFAQIRRTAEEVSAINPGQVVTLKGSLRHLRIFLPLLFAFSIVFAFDPQTLSRSMALILHPLSNLPLRETLISLDPKGSIGAARYFIGHSGSNEGSSSGQAHLDDLARKGGTKGLCNGIRREWQIQLPDRLCSEFFPLSGKLWENSIPSLQPSSRGPP